MRDIVTISGTSRPDNYTAKALGVVNDAFRERGVEPTVFDARDLELNFPGEPETEDAARLKESVAEADAVVLASPEYHGSFAAMTKLIIESMGFPSVLDDTPTALLGVASGRIGAIKTLEHLRGVCSHVGALVLPRPVSVAGVRKSFDEEGNCVDEDVEEMLDQLADTTIEYVKKIFGPHRILEEMSRRDGDHSWVTTI
jgi:NAD(P)H-dependent FMN reductase